jgi:hypothetical protein
MSNDHITEFLPLAPVLPIDDLFYYHIFKHVNIRDRIRWRRVSRMWYRYSISGQLRIYTIEQNFPTEQTLLDNPNLVALDLQHNEAVTDYALASLKNLTFLDISHNTTIGDVGLCKLTNLSLLIMRNNSMITDQSLLLLTQLTYLDTSGAKHVTCPPISISQNTSLDSLTRKKKTDQMRSYYEFQSHTCCGLTFFWASSLRDHQMEKHNKNPWELFDIIYK